VPQTKPFRSPPITGGFDSNSLPETSSDPAGDISEYLDESSVLSFLKELIAAREHSLDTMLGTITDLARQLTGASGAALAMWKDGLIVCRARSGETAPLLGAQLSVKTGISGECLRTGKIQRCVDTENDPLVDLQVCRSLGLRSIAVLPIRGRRRISGILEVFSPRPAAFTKQHIAFLQQLADLAERARTSQPENASSAAARLPSVIEQEQTTGPLPASDLARDVAVVPPRSRSRPFVVGAIGLVAVSLLALAIWLGGRGRNQAKGNANVAPSSTSTASVNSANAGTATAGAATLLAASPHPPDNDPVWKANPDGEPLSTLGGKPSAGVSVKSASKVDLVVGKKIQTDRTQPGRSLSPGSVAPNVVVKYGLANPQTESNPDARSLTHSDVTAPVEALPSPAGATSSSALNAVLSARVSLPGLGVPVSQGVSGGQLVHRVPPVYPAQARVQRLEGKVVLAAVIMEDGTLRDVKVIEGQPLLAQSAVDAVKLWRYKPYVLDGKAVKNETTITIDFKFPGSNH
jgi:TonB family protein